MEKNFKSISNKIRHSFLQLLKQGYKYHLGGTASCIDLLVTLFYGNYISLKKNDDCAGMSYIENNNEIPAIIYKDNFIGTKFHPEKSKTNGNKFLEFFLNWKKN